MTLTVAATPQFIAQRLTANPLITQWFVIASVIGVVLLAFGAIRAFYRSHAEHLVHVADRERMVVEAAALAGDAHERTIAYACHQLRYDTTSDWGDMVLRTYFVDVLIDGFSTWYVCRNPLHALCGSANLMLDESRGLAGLAEDLSVIVSASGHVSRLISDVADWDTVRSGVRPMKRSAVDVRVLLPYLVSISSVE